MPRSAPTATSGSTLTLALAGIFMRFVKQALTALKSRREVARLNDLDDRALKDIGLLRSDVHSALAESFFSDPSHHLVDVAGHKRGVSRPEISAKGSVLPSESLARLRRNDAAVISGPITPAAC